MLNVETSLNKKSRFLKIDWVLKFFKVFWYLLFCISQYKYLYLIFIFYIGAGFCEFILNLHLTGNRYKIICLFNSSIKRIINILFSQPYYSYTSIIKFPFQSYSFNCLFFSSKSVNDNFIFCIFYQFQINKEFLIE